MHRLVAATILFALLAAPALARGDGRLPAALSPANPPAETLALDAGSGAGGGEGANVVLSALYGGLAGALVGAGIGLIEGGNYARDIAVGAGVGIVAGATWGIVSGASNRSERLAGDGMNSTDRDPVMTGHAAGVIGRF